MKTLAFSGNFVPSVLAIWILAEQKIIVQKPSAVALGFGVGAVGEVGATTSWLPFHGGTSRTVLLGIDGIGVSLSVALPSASPEPELPDVSRDTRSEIRKELSARTLSRHTGIPPVLT